MLLTYLDRMRPGHAFIGTTNLDVANLTERFQTRFQSVRLQPPETRFSRNSSPGGGELVRLFSRVTWDLPPSRQVRQGGFANGKTWLSLALLASWR